MFSGFKNYVGKKMNQRRMEQKGLVGSRKRRTDSWLVNAADQSKVLGTFMLILLWAVCALMLTLPSLRPTNIMPVKGRQAEKTIFADFDFAYENRAATLELQKVAMDKVPFYFKISDFENNRAQNNMDSFLSALIARVNAEKQKKKYNPGSGFFASLTAGLSENVVMALFELVQNDRQRENFEKELNLALGQGIMGQEAKSSYKVGQQIRIIDSRGRDRLPKPAVDVPTPEEVAELIADAALKYYSPSGDRQQLRKSLVDICRNIIGAKGNLVLDTEKTAKQRQAAAASVTPVMIEVKKYQPLVTRGQVVTEAIIERLQAYQEAYQGRIQETGSGEKVFRNLILSLILMFFIGIYMFHIHREVVKSNQKLALTGSVVIVSLLVNYMFIEGFNFFSTTFGIPPSLINDSIPMTLAAVLLAVMVGFRVALYVGFFVSAITAMMLGHSFDVALEGLVVCSLAAIAVRHSSNYRSFFLRTLLVVFLVYWLLDFNFIWNISTRPEILLWAGVASFINGLATATIALILIFVFELLFNVSTNMSLLMLCDYNHPLLKRLQLEAPGTFHHSLMVATLAEYAAKAINANPIKARVCAIFHDIGKLTKPEYFSENIVAEDKHSDLHPRMSSLIILNHVKEGIDLALKYKLRKVIRDAIQQHHGNDIVYYFYRRALEENKEKGAQVDEGEYRYPGPLPKEKEVVIVSLADACEAASRSLQKPTPNKIETLVWEIIRKRIRDGQLNDAQITIAELSKIKESFSKTLTTMNHGRIAYPEDKEDEGDLFMEAQKKSASEQKTDKKDVPAGD